MPDLPYFPIYPGDYMADTRDLSATEHGAYLLLLMSAWTDDYCTIPNDPKRLRRVAAVDEGDWPDVWRRIEQFFTVDGDRLYQKRLRQEHQKASLRRENGRAAGLRSAQAREAKSNQSATSDPTKIQPTTQPKSNIPDPEPEPDPELDPELSLGTSSPVALRPPETAENGPKNFSLDDCRAAMAAYNAMADRTGNPRALTLNSERTRKMKSRLSECGGLDGWNEALEMVEQSKFLTGRTDKNFLCGLDFMLQPSSFLKIMEGFYNSIDEPRNRTPMSNVDNVEDTLSSLRRISNE